MAEAIGQNRTDAGAVTMLADILVPERNSFAVVRLALAVAVLASHSYWLTTGDGTSDPLVAATGRSLGELAALAFFFLSGLLVTQSLMRSRSLADFAAGRALRILPALVVCVLATALLVGPWLSIYPASIYFGDPALIAYIAKTSALMSGNEHLPGVFPLHAAPRVVNPSLWTLSYEVACYAGLALLAFAGIFDRRWRRTATLLLAVAVGLAFVTERQTLHVPLIADNGRAMALIFAVGVLAYMGRRHIEIAPALLLPLASLVIIAADTRFADLALALLVGYAVLATGAVDLGWLRRAANATDLSYGIYLYAVPVQQAMLQLYPGTPALSLTLAALAVVVPVAGLSWSLIEKPLLGLRRREPRSVFDSAPVIERALARRAIVQPVPVVQPTMVQQQVLGPISSRLAALRAAEIAAATEKLPRLPRRDWRYARRRVPQTRRNRLMADVQRYAPSRRARIRARLRPVYPEREQDVAFRPYLVWSR